jgi:hypothetical protein
VTESCGVDTGIELVAVCWPAMTLPGLTPSDKALATAAAAGGERSPWAVGPEVTRAAAGPVGVAVGVVPVVVDSSATASGSTTVEKMDGVWLSGCPEEGDGGCVGSTSGSCVFVKAPDDGQESPVVGSTAPGGALAHAGEIGGEVGESVDEGSPSVCVGGVGSCVGSASGSWVFVESSDGGQGSPVVGSTAPGGAFTHAGEIGGVSVGTDGSAMPVDEGSPSAGGGCVGPAPGSCESSDDGQGSPVVGSTAPGGAFTHAGEVSVGTDGSVTPVAVGSATVAVTWVESGSPGMMVPVAVGTAVSVVLVDDGTLVGGKSLEGRSAVEGS